METISLEAFKGIVAAFTKEAPELDDRNLEAGFRAVGSAYLTIPADNLSIIMAASYFEYASRKYWDRRMALDCDGNPFDTLRSLTKSLA